MKIFIDSSALLALYNVKDQYHVKGQEISRSLFVPNVNLITSDYVLDEVYSGLISVRQRGVDVISQFDKDVEQGVFEVIYVDEDIFRKTRKYFKKFSRDKLWSFTDCTSYVIMKEMEVNKVFTFDEDFKQMGFFILRP